MRGCSTKSVQCYKRDREPSISMRHWIQLSTTLLSAMHRLRPHFLNLWLLLVLTYNTLQEKMVSYTSYSNSVSSIRSPESYRSSKVRRARAPFLINGLQSSQTSNLLLNSVSARLYCVEMWESWIVVLSAMLSYCKPIECYFVSLK